MANYSIPVSAPETLFDKLAKLLEEAGARPPERVVEHATPLDLRDYLELYLPHLRTFLEGRAMTTSESWKGFVGYSRIEDVEQLVLPAVIERLTAYAATGVPDEGFAAVADLVCLMVRELIRTGKFPAYVKMEELTAMPAHRPDLI